MRKIAFYTCIVLISVFIFSCTSNDNDIVQSEVTSSSQSQATKLSEITPQYDSVNDFSEGLAAVCIDNKLGYIDKTGEIIVSLKYENIGYLGCQEGVKTSDFIDGLALVKRNDKYGFIDKTGNEVTPCKYDEAYSFSEGMASVRIDTRWGFIDSTGKEVVPPKYDSVTYFNEGMAAVANGGDLYINPDEETDRIIEYTNSKWGFIDKAGTEVVLCQYNFSGKYKEGVAIMNTGSDLDKRNHYKMIDKTGKEIVPEGKYTWFGEISEGLVAVSVDKYPNDKWGFIDLSGNEVIPCVNDFVITGLVPSFSEGLVWFKTKNGRYGVIDTSGKIIVQPDYYEFIWYFKESMSRIKVSDKYGFIDKTGKEIINPKYGWASDFKEGMARVCMNYSQIGEWGFVDKTGREITSFNYFEAHNFSEGYAAVNIGNRDIGKWGFIDKNGNTVVDCKYSDVNSYKEGMAAVCLNNKWGFIPYPD